MKTLCYSVRLKSLVSISDKAYKAISFDGSTDIIPKSCVFGDDFGVIKSDAYWIAAWILPKKNIQYTEKKQAYFGDDGKIMPSTTITKHFAEIKKPIQSNKIKDLKK